MIPTTTATLIPYSSPTIIRRTFLTTTVGMAIRIRPRISIGATCRTATSTSSSQWHCHDRYRGYGGCVESITTLQQIKSAAMYSTTTTNDQCWPPPPPPPQQRPIRLLHFDAATTTTHNRNTSTYTTIQRHWLSSSNTFPSNNMDGMTTTSSSSTDSSHSNISSEEIYNVTPPLSVLPPQQQPHPPEPPPSSYLTEITETVTSAIDATTFEMDTYTSQTSTIYGRSIVESVEPAMESISSIEMNNRSTASNSTEERNITTTTTTNNNIVMDDIGEIISQPSFDNNSSENNHYVASLLVHEHAERTEFEHQVPVHSIATDIPESNVDLVGIAITTEHFDDIPNDINKNHDNAFTPDRKDKNRVSLVSFMAGERPITPVTDTKENENVAKSSSVIKPRAQHIIRYKSHGKPALSTSQHNGFIPKANLRSARPTITKDYSQDIPYDNSNYKYKESYEDRKQNQNMKKKEAVKNMLSNVGKKLLVYTKLQPRLPNQLIVLGDHLVAQGEKLIPISTWVHVEGISPVSSLDAILDGIQHALDIEEENGFVDLDAAWNEGEPIPFLPLSDPTQNGETTTSNSTISSSELTYDENISTKPHKWVQKAKLILSPYARPTGWYLKFANRSIAYSLLRHAQERPVRSAWRQVRIKEYKHRGTMEQNDDPNTINSAQDPISSENLILNEEISDATLRLENCPFNVTEASMLNFFSRYDLKSSVGVNNSPPIQHWYGTTLDGKECRPTTYLVHFADSSWARAALREKQGTFMSKMGQAVINSSSNPKPLHLVQYPRQIL